MVEHLAMNDAVDPGKASDRPIEEESGHCIDCIFRSHFCERVLTKS